MHGLLGLVPFLILFATLGFTRIPSHVASPATALVACLLAWAGWGMSGSGMAGAALEGAIIALVPILWVIFGAVFVFLVCTESGAVKDIREGLVKLCPEKPIQAVLIAFCFGGFLEAVAGFGTAVAIPTAMLITLGFDAAVAATVCLVANSVPVAFGALGIPVIALAKVTGLDQALLTRHVAVQLTAFAVLVPVAIAYLADPSRRPSLRVVAESVFVGAVFASTQLAVAFLGGPELVAIASSLAAMAAYALLRRIMHSGGERVVTWGVARGVLPFVILLGLVLVTRLVDIPLLARWPFSFEIGGFEHPVRIDAATTPGTLLLLAAFIGGMVQGVKPRRLAGLLRDSAVKIRWTAVTIISILVLAKVMGNSGMIGSVAAMLAAVSGAAFPAISPLLGAMGTFVTGSDTSSNILLGELQKQTAISTGYDPAWLAAANTSGATSGKMISPQSLSVATSTLGIEHLQRDIFRRTLRYCLIYVAVLGVVILLTSVTSWYPGALTR
jgi:lactate permease